MIDPECPIAKEGQGLCWTLSAAWGLEDHEVCRRCQLKHKVTAQAPLVAFPGAVRVCRACGIVVLALSLWDADKQTCTRADCMTSLKAANLYSTKGANEVGA